MNSVLLIVALALVTSACAHPVLDCTFKEVKTTAGDYYKGPCKPAPAGKY